MQRYLSISLSLILDKAPPFDAERPAEFMKGVNQIEMVLMMGITARTFTYFLSHCQIAIWGKATQCNFLIKRWVTPAADPIRV